MSIENKLISIVLRYLWERYPRVVKDIAMSKGVHIHKNRKNIKTDTEVPNG